MIASNLLVNGAARFLQQAYFTDISVSGTASLASLSATGDITAGGNLYSTTGNLYLKNLLAINGQSDTWLRINANNAFTSGIYFGTSIVRTDGTLQVGSSGAYLKSNSTNTTIANLVAPIATITTGAITTLTASDVNANNVSVANNLHATHFDLQTVAQLGGSFYVSPTVKFPNSGTTLGVAKSGTTLTLTITDSSITSTTMAGIVWTANSRVKVSGTINGVVTGTMDGTVSSINTSSHVLTLSVSGENSGSVVAGTYSASQFSDLSVMVYQRRHENNDCRVGIWMNCYDLETNLTSIRLYGGTTAKPSVMIGNLNQANLDAIGGITPSGWSLYADGAFLKGAIVSTEGQIGGWTIGSTKLYNNTDSLTSQAVGIYLGTDGIRNFASTSQYVNITGGKITALGVDVSGKITATSGAIGGFEINSTAIKTLNVAVTSNADNSISLSSADFTRTINSTSRAGLRFAIGDKFGVTGDGVIYAGSAIISGTLTAGADSKIGPWTVTATSIYKTNATMGNATAGAAYFGDNGLSVTDKFQVTAAGALTATSATVTGTIKADTGYIGGSSGFTITSGKIYSSTHSAYNTAVAGVYIGTDYISLGSGGVTYFKSDGTGKIGPWTLTATSLYKGNATLGTSGNSNIYLGDNGLSLSNKFVYKTSDGSLSLNVSSLSISGTSVPTTTSMNTAIANAQAALQETIIGTQTAATSRWTGTSSYITALTDGLQIRYWLPFAYSSSDQLSYTPTGGSAASGTGLTLTLADGTTTDCIPCFYGGISRITSHYGAGNILALTYRENVAIGSVTVTKGWWADANYDSNTYDRTRYNATIKASANAIVEGNIIVGSSSYTFEHLKLGNAFDVTMPILYAAGAIGANSTGSNNYITIPFTVTTTQSISMTAYKPVYIKGTLSGNTFTPVSTAPLTQTVPTSADGYHYMYLGTAYSATAIWLEEKHPIYMYFGGKFMPIDEIAKTFMYFDATNGLVLSQSEVSSTSDLTSAGGNIRLTGSGMGVYNNNTLLANYGSTTTLYHGTSGKAALTLDSSNGLQMYKLDGSTLAAQLNENGLLVSSGKIGNINITSNAIYSGSHSAYNSSSAGFYLGSNGKFGVGTGTSSYITFDGTDIRINAYSLSIGGSSVATQTYATTQANTAAAAAAGTATNYIYYDADYGLVLSQTGTASTGYNMRLTSTGIEMRRMENVYASYGATIVLGQEGGNHISIDSNGFNLLKGTNTLVSYGSTTTFYHGVNGRKAITLDQNYGLRFYDNTSANNTVAQLNGSGLVVSTGYIGGTSGWTITSGKIYSGTVDSGVTNGSVTLSTTDFSRTINNVSRTGLRFAIGSKFGVSNAGDIYASSANLYGGTIGGFTLENGYLTYGSGDTTLCIAPEGAYFDGQTVLYNEPTSGDIVITESTVESDYLSTPTQYKLIVGSDFRVGMNGQLYSKSGVIGGWELSSDKFAGNSYSIMQNESGIVKNTTYLYSGITSSEDITKQDSSNTYIIKPGTNAAICVDFSTRPVHENRLGYYSNNLYITIGVKITGFVGNATIKYTYEYQDTDGKTISVTTSKHVNITETTTVYQPISIVPYGQVLLNADVQVVYETPYTINGSGGNISTLCSIRSSENTSTIFFYAKPINAYYLDSFSAMSIQRIYNNDTSTQEETYRLEQSGYIYSKGGFRTSGDVVFNDNISMIELSKRNAVQSASKSVAITSSNTIGATPAIGAQLTLTPGTYLLWGRFVFSTAGSGTSRNNRIAFYTGASPTNSTMLSESQVCVFTAARDWGALTTTYIVSPTENTTYTVGGTSSLPGPDGGTSVIKAIRLL